MWFRNSCIISSCLLTVQILASGCNKLVQIPEPVNTITTSETFHTDANATSALVGIYNDLISGGAGNNFSYGNGLLTYLGGLSADEMRIFDQGNTDLVQFQHNALQYSNSQAGDHLWTPAYYDIYMANAVIEGLEASPTINPATKNQLLGEARFLRAFSNFYLVNFFGDIPLVTTTAWKKTDLLSRTSTAQVYQQMVQDLRDAQGLLASDFSVSNGDRTRANKYTAMALLARVYLYMKNWTGADSAASAVINNTGLFNLLPTSQLNNVFLANSTEAIWQLVPNAISNYATFEGLFTLPSPLATGAPVYTLTHQLLNAFEPGDNRWGAWVDSTNNNGSTYSYYPFKYKLIAGSSGNITECYMMLRLAEQYLIRAEAKANEGPAQINAAISDLNVIRNRAGLGAYAGGTDQASVLNAIEHERQIELFAEWGHRWLDLKRWGTAVSVLSSTKGFAVPAYQLLYPIPFGEITSDPNLVQNPGY